MEVKINKEIREYTENVFFGLSLRQFFFSVCTIVTTVLLYFLSSKFLGKESLSWLCIIGACPFAVLGFFKYNGMPAEKIIMCYLRSEFIIPKKMTFKPNNFYYELTKDFINQKESEEKKIENIENVI